MKPYPVNRMNKTFLVADISREMLSEMGYADTHKISNEKMQAIADAVSARLNLAENIDDACQEFGVRLTEFETNMQEE